LNKIIKNIEEQYLSNLSRVFTSFVADIINILEYFRNHDALHCRYWAKAGIKISEYFSKACKLGLKIIKSTLSTLLPILTLQCVHDDVIIYMNSNSNFLFPSLKDKYWNNIAGAGESSYHPGKTFMEALVTTFNKLIGTVPKSSQDDFIIKWRFGQSRALNIVVSGSRWNYPLLDTTVLISEYSNLDVLIFLLELSSCLASMWKPWIALNCCMDISKASRTEIFDPEQDYLNMSLLVHHQSTAELIMYMVLM
jgi:hypothetical protein